MWGIKRAKETIHTSLETPILARQFEKSIAPRTLFGYA
jgi:hypothetical protein